uniref:TGF-beta-activated kinase 1 and MAP3K7-binding protein 1 n=2 Tax=Cacopsylla melanoneura TaxID=428564 RepID=A0A8D8S6T9_9HEMI
MPTTLEYRELQSSKSWTDDLPVCKSSGIGSSTSQIYCTNGQRQEKHHFEDCFVSCKYDNDTFLYVIFDGNDGRDMATFALQRIAAEILLGQLVNKTNEAEIKEIIRQAFLAVENSYLQTIGDKIAERTQVQLEIPEDLTSYEAFNRYPHLVKKLEELNSELSCGASALLALIHFDKLYIANVGDCRALLCKTDSNNVLRVQQLTVDHTLDNEDEILRLNLLQVKIDKNKCSKVGNVDVTRCLGNYLVKGGYKDFEEMADAIGEPIISEPEIHGPIQLNDSCRFLMLMSKGLYKSLEEATGAGTEKVNKDLAQMAVEEFRRQSSLTSVAQAVIDRVARIHYDMAMTHGDMTSREDITLIIRNFNFPLPNSISAPAPGVRFNMNETEPEQSDFELTLSESIRTDVSTSTTTTTESTEQTNSSEQDGPIKPYVDFSEFYRNIELAKKNGTLPKDLDFD